MSDIYTLSEHLQQQFGEQITHCEIACGQITVEVPHEYLHQMCLILRDDPRFRFEQLIDICGIDYLHYGMTWWDTQQTTETGFSRGVRDKHEQPETVWQKPRFAVIYHLLSVSLNHRVRLKVFANNAEPPLLDSVIDIWASADWFEREAFDLFGIVFKDHPDLRRLLTDYGFVGHPFRKDFPLIGNVEIRYDAAAQRCVYEPVSIQPRTLVPKVIRDDHRYLLRADDTVEVPNV